MSYQTKYMKIFKIFWEYAMLQSRQEPALNTWPPWPRAYASSFLLFPLLRPFLAAAVSQ